MQRLTRRLAFRAQSTTVGLMSSVFAEEEITVLYHSTFENADIILIPRAKLAKAHRALSARGFSVEAGGGVGSDGDEENPFAQLDESVDLDSSIELERLSDTEDRERRLSAKRHKEKHPVVLLPARVFLLGIPHETVPDVSLVLIRLLFFDVRSPARFLAFTKTDHEVSLVVDESYLELLDPNLFNVYSVPWRVLQIGTKALGFDETGIVARTTQPLAADRIPIFYQSSFSRDFVLVHEKDEAVAVDALRNQGFEVYDEDELDAAGASG